MWQSSGMSSLSPQSSSSGSDDSVSGSPKPPKHHSKSLSPSYEIRTNYTITLPDGSHIKVEDKIGEGTFGSLFLARHSSTNREFALKVLPRKTSQQVKWSDAEARILMRIRSERAYLDNLIKLSTLLTCNGCMCLLMEKLDVDMWRFIKDREHRPLALEHVRSIGNQILTAVARLHAMSVMHTDIKPENIMFVDRDRMGMSVKLIDYGSAANISVCASNTGAALQTIYYRSPEVLFGLPFNQTIDVWSVGCVLAELYMGCALYPGSTEYQVIRMISCTQGIPQQLSSSKYFSKYMVKVKRSTSLDGVPLNKFRMKTEAECHADGIEIGTDKRWYKLRKLDEIIDYGYNKVQTAEQLSTYEDDLFLDCLSSLLSLDVPRRPDAAIAMTHPFFSGVSASLSATGPPSVSHALISVPTTGNLPMSMVNKSYSTHTVSSMSMHHQQHPHPPLPVPMNLYYPMYAPAPPPHHHHHSYAAAMASLQSSGPAAPGPMRHQPLSLRSRPDPIYVENR